MATAPAQDAGKTRFRDTEAASGLTMISPTAIYAILLLAAPLLAVVIYSFMTKTPTGVALPLTVDNYVTVWTEVKYRTIMFRSLQVSMIVTLATVALAYPLAYFISFNVDPAKKSLWLFLVTIPFWTSYLIRVFLWKVVLGYNGVLSSALERVCVPWTDICVLSGPMSFMTDPGSAIVITLAHAYAPFAILPIFVALEKIDRSYLEAGQDLGESRWTTFLRVTLPLSMPGVIAAVLIVFIPTIGDYVTPTLIGGGKFPMIANMIQVEMLKQNNRPLGSAIAVSAMLIVLVVTLIFLLLNRRFLRATK
ncbi:MAG: ABC transporter permease [Paracoccaceae bacterium]